MRYLFLLSAILAGTPVWADEFTHTLELRPGFVEQWMAPEPFQEIHVSNPDVIDVAPYTNQGLMVTMKPKGGTANILLTDKDGKLIANVLVTNPGPQYQLVRNARTGTWQMYRTDDTCFPFCVTNTEPTPKPQSDEGK
jgi:Flp pilus assembly secretin CpaC